MRRPVSMGRKAGVGPGRHYTGGGKVKSTSHR